MHGKYELKKMCQMSFFSVPSKIINELSSKDKTVREGDKVELVCNVTGVPTPEVMWYKLPTEGQQKKESRSYYFIYGRC